MDTKILYTFALVIASVVGGFYYYSGKSEKLTLRSNQDLSSTADKIYITQTNENGQLYAKAQVQHMTQWMTSGDAKLEQVQAIMYKNGQPYSTFHSDKAMATDDYRNVELAGNVRMSQLNSTQQPNITFVTEKLHGDTKTNQIQTDYLVTVTNPQAKFTSQGLKADLTIGHYEFFNIRAKYDSIYQ